MAPTGFVVLTANVPAAQADLFVETCWELGTLGLQQIESAGDVSFKAYFDPDFPPWRLISAFSGIRGLRSAGLTVGREEDRAEEWLSNWKAGFTGFEAGPEVWIHPGWEPASRRHAVNILMEPGHAFGTGTHESTRLCLRALPEAAPERGRILDVGTGSGILAIAAAKLKPKAKVFAIDNDPLAAGMAAENFRKNSVSVALAAAGPSAVRGRFDFVAANLTLSIFRRHADAIAGLARGPVLASGFTDEQAPSAAELFRRAGGFATARSWTLNDWVCLLLLRSTTPQSTPTEPGP